MRIEAQHREYLDSCVLVDGSLVVLGPSLKLRNHSPTGFAWGYGGSGPAQLALAILLHAGVPEEQALDLYQQFKWDVIAKQPGRQSWTLDLDLPAWILEHQRRAP